MKLIKSERGDTDNPIEIVNSLIEIRDYINEVRTKLDKPTANEYQTVAVKLLNTAWSAVDEALTNLEPEYESRLEDEDKDYEYDAEDKL